MKYSKFNKRKLLKGFKNTVLLAVYFTLFLGFFRRDEIVVGADQMSKYIPLLRGKRVGVIANQSSLVKEDSRYVHLVDKLIQKGIEVKKIFAPEHGFRGDSGAGELIENNLDEKTKLPVISLYGNNKKMNPSQLEDIDIIIFDIQDVGVRFYTYISTLHYVMQAAAKYDKPLIVLDRPNPNAHYVDGPIMESKFKSFVGMHPVPIVYGLTIGEYALMINGEKWLGEKLKCNLKIIILKHYNHQSKYHLPVPPSPNLPNDRAINLYPSLCLFEGTNISIGRGTDKPFQIYGGLNLSYGSYLFTPKPNKGSQSPKHKEQLCRGENLEHIKYLSKIHLKWLMKAYEKSSDKAHFFTSFFSKLAGTTLLRQQIEQGLSEKEIKETWRDGIERFKKIRRKYMLYP